MAVDCPLRLRLLRERLCLSTEAICWTERRWPCYGGAIGDAELQVTDELYSAPSHADEFEQVMMFLDHACEPNVRIQGQIVFVAMRNAAAGEELTFD